MTTIAPLIGKECFVVIAKICIVPKSSSHQLRYALHRERRHRAVRIHTQVRSQTEREYDFSTQRKHA